MIPCRRPRAFLLSAALSLVGSCLLGMDPLGAVRAEEEPAASPPEKTLARTEEPVIVSGAVLPMLSGWDARWIGVFALQQGRLEPIPFQIDEKTSQGQWALAAGPSTVSDDDDPEAALGGRGGRDTETGAPNQGKKEARKEAPILDKSDEIVFLTGDTGDRAPRSLWPEGWKVGAEIQVEDPTSGGGKGWVYVLGMESPAPRSGLKYVRYDMDAQRIYTKDFALGFSKKIPVTWDYLTISTGKEGEYLENRIDRLKIRAGATMLFGGIKIMRNEEDFESDVLGWNDGAVRIIRQVENSVNLLLGIQSPSGIFESVYYRNCIIVPTTVRVPFKPSLFFTDVILRGGIDFRDLKGWKAITSRNLKPVEITGRMTDEKKAWDLGDTDWVVFFKDDLAFMSRLILEGDLVGKVSRNIYFVDDENATDPPEFYPGLVPELLYDMRGWKDVSSGVHRLYTVNYAIRGYHVGDERTYVDIVTHPCRVTIGKGSD